MSATACALLRTTLLVSLLLSGSVLFVAADLEGFDVDDEPAPPQAQKIYNPEDDMPKFAQQGAPAKVGENAAEKKQAAVQRPPPPPMTKDQYMMEAISLVLLIAFVINILIGTQQNKKLIKAWGAAFAAPGGIIDRNFAQLGPGNTKDIFMYESASMAKLYCSGRRYCQGMLVTLQLRSRQDAVSAVWALVDPVEDQVVIEVNMNEGSMPLLCLAVAPRKAAAALQRDQRVVRLFTKKINVAKDQVLGWPAEKLYVLAEQSSHFYDLFGDSKVSGLFNPSSAYGPSVLKHFRGLHFSADQQEGHKCVLSFVFALPPVDKMDELSKLMEMVPLFIDMLGCYKLTPELKKKAMDARNNMEDKDTEEERKKRMEALQTKKEDKAKEEKARIARMAPDARAKYEEKQSKAQVKKMQNKKTLRM